MADIKKVTGVLMIQMWDKEVAVIFLKMANQFCKLFVPAPPDSLHFRNLGTPPSDLTIGRDVTEQQEEPADDLFFLLIPFDQLPRIFSMAR